jgi:diguanylate cyclase (GGDEF)-like protein/PAS domain S-box-containing protein
MSQHPHVQHSPESFSMSQERQAQLSRLVERSLRASLMLVALLTLTGIMTAVGLLVIQGYIVSGHDALLEANQITNDAAGVRLLLDPSLLAGDESIREGWTVSDAAAEVHLAQLRNMVGPDPTARAALDVVAARLAERQAAAAPFLRRANMEFHDDHLVQAQGREYLQRNAAFAAAVSGFVNLEHARLESLRSRERMVLAIAGIFLLALVGWWSMTLRRSRLLARELLIGLEEAVHATERGRAQLQAITDAAPLAVFHVDSTGDSRWLNAQASEWAGHPASKDVASAMVGRIHPDDRASVTGAWRRLIEQGGRFESRFRFAAAEGMTIWAHARAVPVIIDGVTTGYAAVMQDITEERLLSEEIVRSRRRMRKLTDSVPALLARLDHTDTYRFVNATYRTWFGDDAPVVGSTLQEFLGTDAHSRLQPALDRVRAGHAVQLEMPHANLKGRAFVGDITYTPDLDDDGKYCGFYVLVTDVSERKRLEDSLFAAKELAQVTLDSIADAVITTDNMGIVTSLNKQAEALLDHPATRARGLPIDAVVNLTEADGTPAAIPLLRAIAGEVPLATSRAKSLLREDGSQRAIEDVASPIRDRSGAVIGGVLVLRDVSATQALADEMQRLAEADVLTGLPNRMVFDRRLRAALTSREETATLAVLYMDLDGFKSVNDTFGHDAGDALLQEMARRFRTRVSEMETVCRLGGDEFVVLLPAPTSRREAVVLAEAFLEVARAPVRWGSHDLFVTLSVGVAVAPADGTEAHALMRWADQTLYAAKQSGKDKVVVLY